VSEKKTNFTSETSSKDPACWQQ